MNEEFDLFRLAFIPGVFRCPTCEFELTKTAVHFKSGRMGTTEKERMGEPCPNDGTKLRMVTYRERVEQFDKAYTEAQQQIADLTATLAGTTDRQMALAAQVGDLVAQLTRARAALAEDQAVNRDGSESALRTIREAFVVLGKATQAAAISRSLPAIYDALDAFENKVRAAVEAPEHAPGGDKENNR